MFKNYLKVALRNMSRQKGYTFINISGLAIGMAACIVILLFVQHELSYDRYHKNSDRIVRLSRQWFDETGQTALHLGHLAPPFAPLLKNDFEGVVLESVRFMVDNPLMTLGDKKFQENRFYFADSSTFKVFSWEMLAGNPQTALNEPNSLVITESMAKKYFGNESALGQTLNYDNLTDMKITGIVKDIPENSHFQWDMLASFQTLENYFGKENMMRNWGSNNYAVYLLLPEGYNSDELAAQIPEFLDKHLGEWNGVPASTYNQLNIWQLTDVHLHSHLDSEIGNNGNIIYVYLFSVIAFLILLIAGINFVNLSTARAGKRRKEVGLRKVVGAFRTSLIKQFLTESLLVTLIATALAILMVELVLPLLNDNVFQGLNLSLDYTANPLIIVLTMVMMLIVGIGAGAYPAFYLSAVQPASILRKSRSGGGYKSWLRSGLVVFQFSIFVMLIVGVGMIRQQVQYMQDKPLGFNQEHIVSLPIDEGIYDRFESVKEQLLRQPGIEEVSISSRIPSGRLLDSQGSEAEVAGEMKDVKVRTSDVHVGHDYFEIYDVDFVAGRNFDKKLASDSTQSFIINEAAVRVIGWESSQEAIGKKMRYGERNGTIIGVTKDFHFESLHHQIMPIVFMVTNGRARHLSIRINGAAEPEVMAFLEEKWTTLRPGFPFDPVSVEQNFDTQYEEEASLAELVMYFSFLAILIAALGLLGLASFTTEQRFREIGIRKVLGASVGQVLVLLTQHFSYLVLMGSVAGGLFAYILIDQLWTDNFAYQSGIKALPFLAGSLLAFVTAWVVVGFQAYKAASLNPVEAIKHEG